MSHNLSLLFLYPFITNFFSLNTFRLLLSNSTLQLLSQIWPKDINDELENYGRTVACYDILERYFDIDSIPLSIECILCELGKIILTNVFFLSLSRIYLSSGYQ